MWLFVTTLLGLLSGWFQLGRRFPDRAEASLLTLRSKSGIMGLGVNFNGCLTLSACPSGLRVGVWRMFGVFQRPFLVPWEEITVGDTTSFFAPMARLGFGRGEEVGKLKIDAGVWNRLSSAAHTTGRAAVASVTVSDGRIAARLLLQWAVITGVATAFYFFASRAAAAAGAPHMPFAVCFGFPAVVFGVPQLIRYFRQRPSWSK